MEEKDTKLDLIDKLLLAFLIVFAFINVILILTTDVNAASDYHNVVTDAVYTGTAYCSTNQKGLCVSDTSSNVYSRYTFGTTSYQNTLSFHFVLNTSVYAKVNATVRLTGSNWANVNYTCVSSFSNCRVVRASSTILNINFTNNTNSNVTYGEFFVTGNGSILNTNDTFYVQKADLYETLIQDNNSSSGTNNSDIINNQNQNTQDLINNQNDNTEDIINNNNSNTQEITNTITNFLGITCKNMFNARNFTSSNFATTNINDNVLTLTANQTWRTVAYTFNVIENTSYILHYDSDSTGAIAYYSFDNSNWIQVNNGSYLTLIPNTQNIYVRLQNTTIGNGTYIFNNLTLNPGIDKNYCVPGQVSSQFDSLRNSQNETNELIKDDSIDQGQANSFFNDFSTSDNGGISSIVTKPLRLINNLLSSNSNCNALNFTIPGFSEGMQDTLVSLPSGCAMWNQAPNSLIVVWNALVVGSACYVILKKLFKLIEALKNPDDDRVEVIDL